MQIAKIGGNLELKRLTTPCKIDSNKQLIWGQPDVGVRIATALESMRISSSIRSWQSGMVQRRLQRGRYL